MYGRRKYWWAVCHRGGGEGAIPTGISPDRNMAIKRFLRDEGPTSGCTTWAEARRRFQLVKVVLTTYVPLPPRNLNQTLR